jgi:competence protein ComEA
MFISLILLYVGQFFVINYIIENKLVKEEKPLETNEIKKEETIDEPEYIYVDLKGAIENPNVYKLLKGSRTIDLINEAGGLLNNANTRFINLSKELKDGDAIVIYTNEEIEEAKKSNIIYVETPCICEEVKNDACYNDTINSNNNSIININTATLEELMTLTGIGEAKAKSIIEYRENNGPFSKIEDIINVKGISETIFNNIKENITI